MYEISMKMTNIKTLSTLFADINPTQLGIKLLFTID